jgi:hypothetical protein
MENVSVLVKAPMGYMAELVTRLWSKCGKGAGKGKLTQVIDVHDTRVTRACSFLAGLCFRILTDAADGRVDLGEI